MKKTLHFFVPIFTVIAVLTSIINPLFNMSEDISEKVFRLHILANSDEEFDQRLKLEVKDEILKDSKEIFKNCKSIQDAVNSANDNIKQLEETALKVIKSRGYNYTIKAYTTKEYFNTRVYDGFTLPAGIYNSLMLEIGQGKGKNWWCVMFPSVCISGCTDDFSEVLSDEEIKLIEEDKYIVRFKVIEIYEKLKNKL